MAPSCPPLLTMISTYTLIEDMELKDDHQEEKRVYLEFNNVEKSLQWHVQEAIEYKYIESLV